MSAVYPLLQNIQHCRGRLVKTNLGWRWLDLAFDDVVLREWYEPIGDEL